MLSILTGDLGPTATYSRRSFAWVSNGSGEVDMPDGEIVPGLGKLTIKLQHGRRCGCKCELDTYAVGEVEPEEIGTRLFLLLSLTDADQREPYSVTIGGANRCRCLAGIVDRYACKHRDALAALIEAGELLSV
jgi:hypothetical protein